MSTMYTANRDSGHEIYSPGETKKLIPPVSDNISSMKQSGQVGDLSLQLSFPFDTKKGDRSSFRMQPSVGTPSEISVSWSGDTDGQVEINAPAGRKWARKAKQDIRNTCTTQFLKRRFPIISWLPKYTVQSAFQDWMAGLTVALTAIPQGIAYGAVAGVPVEYGLYTAFAGPFIYAILGSVSQITMGPTAVMALMTHQYVLKGGAQYAIVLSFLAGCFELLAGILNLGFLLDFISAPVISGFCSAAAVTVILSQLKSILGLSFRGSSFIDVLPGFFNHWRSISVWDSTLGLTFIIFLVLLKNLTRLKKSFSSSCCLHRPFMDKLLWFISTCRNSLAVILGCLTAYLLEIYGYRPFHLLGDIKSGIPSFEIPPFTFERGDQEFQSSFNWTVVSDGGNKTSSVVTFDAILKDLGPGMILIPIVAILEQVAIAKAFSGGKKTDATQEMIALGVGSIFCSFFGCIPLTASFSRSSVLAASGGKTQFASFFNGCVILLALAFLMPTFYFIPKSVLGAVLITAVYPMIEYHEILPMWRGRRIELMPFLTTFACCLLINMEYGILIGAQLHLLILAYEASRSKSTCTHYKEGNEERIVMKSDRNLYFPSVERFRNALAKVSQDKIKKQMIVLDLENVTQVDHTSLKMLKSILLGWDKTDEKYCFVNVSDSVKRNLLSIFPKGLPMTRPTLLSTDTTISFG